MAKLHFLPAGQQTGKIQALYAARPPSGNFGLKGAALHRSGKKIPGMKAWSIVLDLWACPIVNETSRVPWLSNGVVKGALTRLADYTTEKQG